MSGRPTTGTDRPDKNPWRDEQAAPPWRSLTVVMGPSVLVVIYAIVGTLATILSALAPRRSESRRLLRTALVGGALLPWAYLLIVRPWHSRWGATEEEARRVLPYDHFVPDPIYQTTRAMTINSPAKQVWRWLVQMGQGRGGLYSYDWLENLANLDVNSVEEVVPELQDLKVGDLVRLAPESMGAEAGLRVAVMEPRRALVLHQPADPDTGHPIDRDDTGLGNYYGWNWAFVLEETLGGSTRLIVRSRIDGSPRTLIRVFYTLLLEFPHFVMERAMLKGIKERAERTSVAPKASRRFQHEATIGRPVEEVFDFVTDARNEPRYNPRILSVRKTTPGPMGRGTRFVLTSKAMGRPVAFEYEITVYERPHRMISHTIRGLPLVDIESIETFEPVADGTRMRWEWQIRPRGAIGELMTPVLVRALPSRLEGAFGNIKRVLES